MARARNLKPGFFKNEDLAECSPLARLLFAGLWCLADRKGRLEDRPKRIRAEVLPYDDGSVDDMLDELHQAGFILRYGREKPCFNLDRELTLTLVSGYDIPLRHRVVTRLAELESAPKALNPANLSRLQLIELAMQAEQERLALEHKVGELEPKAEALDRIADAEGTMNSTVAAKNLQVQPKRNGWRWVQT